MITDYPEKKCYVCGGDSWWYRMTQGPAEWLCASCGGSPDPLVRLKFRIIKGNFKLNKAWEQLRRMEDSPGKAEILVKWRASAQKLGELCDEMVAAGETECLYIEDGKKVKRCHDDPSGHKCTVCPNSYWVDKEMLEVDKRRNPSIWEV